MNDEDRILEDIKEILKELDEQGRMKYTQRYMQHSDISVYKHCISCLLYTSDCGKMTIFTDEVCKFAFFHVEHFTDSKGIVFLESMFL